jgi:hypothetical protein
VLEIPSGGRACVVVEHSNPVLYSYALTAKPIKVTPPDTMAASIKLLLGLAQAAAPARAAGGVLAMVGARPDEPKDTSFAAAVAAVYRPYLTLVDLKASSDTAYDIATTVKRVASLYADSLKSYKSLADAVYEALKDKSPLQTRMLRAQELETFQKATGIAEEYAAAAGKLFDPMCTARLSGRSRVVLAVTRLAAGKEAPARITGDSVAAFSVEAVSSQDFEFGAGMVVNTLFRRGKGFAVEKGKIVEQDPDDVLFRPVFFGHYRNWGAQWLYATIGTAVSGKTVSDVFLGVTSRFGARSGVGIALGAGLALSEQVTGLKQGAVGEALPSEVANLSDITRKQLRPGLGISLSVSGF